MLLGIKRFIFFPWHVLNMRSRGKCVMIKKENTKAPVLKKYSGEGERRRMRTPGIKFYNIIITCVVYCIIYNKWQWSIVK